MNKTVQVAIRFPADVKAWLVAQAEKNGSSQNSEVIRAVRERMATNPAWGWRRTICMPCAIAA